MKRLLRFLILPCLLFAIFSSVNAYSEEGEVNLSLIPGSLEEIEKQFLSLPAKPQHGKLDRDSFFIWAYSNLLLERIITDSDTAGMQECITIELMEKRYLPGLSDFVVRLEEEQPLIGEISRILSHAVYGIFLEYAYGTKKEVQETKSTLVKQVEEFVNGFKANKKNLVSLKNEALREALAILSAPTFNLYITERTESLNNFDLFLMANMKGAPRQKSPKNTEKREKTYMPVLGLEESGYSVTEKRVKVKDSFHSLINMDGKAEEYIVSRGRFRSESFSSFGGTPRSYFFSNCFLNMQYGGDLNLANEPEVQYEGLLRKPSMPVEILIADQRKVFVEAEFEISRDIRRLCNPKDTAYSYITDLMVTNDHPEFADGMSALKALEKYSPSEIQKYEQYLEDSEVFLLAKYPSTIRAGFKYGVQLLGAHKEQEYLTPDYSSTPEFYLVYLPREWVRHAAYFGPSTVLFEFNLIGLGDRKLRFKDKRSGEEDEAERRWKNKLEKRDALKAKEQALVNPSITPSNVQEIIYTYEHLKKENVNGHVNRDTYLLWALLHYVYKRSEAASKAGGAQCTTMEEFRAKVFETEEALLDEICAWGVRQEAIVSEILKFGLQASIQRDLCRKSGKIHGSFFGNTSITGLFSKDQYEDPVLRQLFAAISTFNSYVCVDTSSTEEEGGRAAFVLAEMASSHILQAHPAKTAEDWERTCYSFPGIADKDFLGGPENLLKVNRSMHPLIFFEGNMPQIASRIMNISQSTRDGVSVYTVDFAGYFRSELFLRSHYGKDRPEVMNYPKYFTGLINRFSTGKGLFADQRSILVDREFVVSRELKRLCDPNDKAYSELFEVMLKSLHPGHSSGIEVLATLSEKSPGVLERYQKFINRCEVFLVADYSRSVKHILTGELRETKNVEQGLKSCTYLTPDFRCVPEYHLLYIPRAKLRVASHSGIQNALKSAKLMGLEE